jgi:hypothetical protein
LNQRIPNAERTRRVSAASSPLRPLEEYEDALLEQDLLKRRAIRVSVPESVARLQGLKHLDWSGEVEIPQPDEASRGGPANELEQRYRLLCELTCRQQGRIFYTMLGGDRYAARVDWGAAPQ